MGVKLGSWGDNMGSKMLGRACVGAAGLLTLLAPSAAFASWWDGGYDGGYSPGRGSGSTTTSTTRPGYRTSPGYDTAPDDSAPPPACNQTPDCNRPPACDQTPDCERPDYAPPPAPLLPPPPFAPIYGCENSDLPGTGLLLHKTTTPPPGTVVRPGDEIFVEITWRVTDWVAPDLHKALDCVYINGHFVPELSGGERPTPNDGHFAWRYFVPANVAPGSTICDRGFVSGPNPWDEYGREVSNVVCFPVELPPPPPPVVETTTTTTPSAEEAQPYTEAERLDQEVPPEEAPPVPAVQHRDVLPRTGGDSGLGRLAAGALALAAVAGRKGRRRAHPPQS
jgi:hypothetical protein